MIIAVLFWLSIGGVFYAYAGYPLLLALLARLGFRRASWEDLPAPEPTVSIIVPVHNELANLPAKLANMRALVYPADRIEIIFVSDGSTDGSVERIHAEGDRRISVIELPGRSGKAAALNAGLARARNDVVVFTDAAIMLAPDALPWAASSSRSPWPRSAASRARTTSPRPAAKASTAATSWPSAGSNRRSARSSAPADRSMRCGARCAIRSSPTWRRTSCRC
jgi:hypothetical protein